DSPAQPPRPEPETSSPSPRQPDKTPCRSPRRQPSEPRAHRIPARRWKQAHRAETAGLFATEPHSPSRPSPLPARGSVRRAAQDTELELGQATRTVLRDVREAVASEAHLLS